MTTLFDLPEPLADLPENYQPQLRTMHREHGIAGNGKVCAQCQHLRHYEYHRKHYFKCNIYGVSNGAGTDWRKSWPACGAWQAQP